MAGGRFRARLPLLTAVLLHTHAVCMRMVGRDNVTLQAGVRLTPISGQVLALNSFHSTFLDSASYTSETYCLGTVARSYISNIRGFYRSPIGQQGSEFILNAQMPSTSEMARLPNGLQVNPVPSISFIV